MPQCQVLTLTQINRVISELSENSGYVPTCASTYSQKGGRGRRPASRKRNDRSPTRTIAQAPQNVRNSSSSYPPPDKKASNDKAPTSKLSQLQSKMSGASALPPPPPPQLPEPIPQQTSTQGSLSQQATPRLQSSQVPQSYSVG